MLVVLLTMLCSEGMSAQTVSDTLHADTLTTKAGKSSRPVADSLKQEPELWKNEMDAPLDTSVMDSLLKNGLTKVRRDKRNFQPDPIRSMWLGLVFPGGGQIYNRKFWKLPIIYGGFLGCTYALTWNNQMLSDYSQAYLDIMDDDPNTMSYEKMLPINFNMSGREEQFKEIFKNRKNYYRKYRDMSILAFIAVYALSVIDAYVDAELSSFDISEDLSFQLQPTFINTDPRAGNRAPGQLHRGHTAVGMSMAVNF